VKYQIRIDAASKKSLVFSIAGSKYLNNIMNKLTIPTQLINFLQSELAMPATSIAFALRQAGQEPNQLPMILWQYGLLTLAELEQVFDWLETVQSA